MKFLDVPRSGSHQAITSSRNRYGQYVRNRATPVNPNTPAQSYVRGLLASSSQGWRGLTDAQRASWNSAASTTPRQDSLGQTIYPTGAQMFVGSYIAQDFAGLTVPPAVPTISPPAAPTLSLLAIDVSSGATINIAEVIGVALVLLIYASPPQSPGINFNGDYRFIGAFTVAVVNVVTFTTQLTDKFGTLQPGQRYFLKATLVTEAGGVSNPSLANVISVA